MILVHTGTDPTVSSLGGGLATANALKTGNREAITFNPAALTRATMKTIDISENGHQQNITNYVVKGEIVNYIQRNFGLHPIGNVKTLESSHLHVLIPGASIINDIKRTLDRRIDTVIDKLK